MVDEPPLGLTRLRISLDRLPLEMPERNPAGVRSSALRFTAITCRSWSYHTRTRPRSCSRTSLATAKCPATASGWFFPLRDTHADLSVQWLARQLALLVSAAGWTAGFRADRLAPVHEPHLPKRKHRHSPAPAGSLAAEGLGRHISIGGAFGLARYHEYRPTHDVDTGGETLSRGSRSSPSSNRDAGLGTLWRRTQAGVG